MLRSFWDVGLTGVIPATPTHPVTANVQFMGTRQYEHRSEPHHKLMTNREQTPEKKGEAAFFYRTIYFTPNADEIYIPLTCMTSKVPQRTIFAEHTTSID